PKGMTAEGVAAEEHQVRRQHACTDSDAELATPIGQREPERLPYIRREDDEEEQRDVHEIAMDVLHDQRERALAEIRLARLANGAVRRIGPERLVVRAAIVIARHPEQPGKRQDQQRRREYEPRRPPPRLRAQERVRRAAEQLWRVEGREVRS